MTIWILMLVLVLLAAACGYGLGVAGSGIMLLGVTLAWALAMPLGPSFAPLVPKLGVTGQVWLWLMPAVLAYAVILLVMLILAIVAQVFVLKHFRNRDDITRFRLSRLNFRTGAVLGIINGLVVTVMCMAAVYPIGYFTYQFANEEKDPFWLKFATRLRSDMAGSGMDRLAARFDYMPKKFYQVTDVLAFLYQNNPQVVNRLSMYPPFLSWSERQDIMDAANEKEFLEFMQSKPGLVDLSSNGRIQGFMVNTELWQLVDTLDLTDLQTFLQTGKSPKYDPFKIVGRWVLDSEEVVIVAKKLKPDITGRELMAVRSALRAMAAGTTFKATTDNQCVLTLKGNVIDFNKLSQMAPPPSRPQGAAPARPQGLGAGGMSGMPAMLRQRYGMAPQPPPQAAAPAPDQATTPPVKVETTTFQGNWEGEENNYTLKVKDPKGDSENVQAQVDADQLSFKAFGQQFVFLRQY